MTNAHTEMQLSGNCHAPLTDAFPMFIGIRHFRDSTSFAQTPRHRAVTPELDARDARFPEARAGVCALRLVELWGIPMVGHSRVATSEN